MVEHDQVNQGKAGAQPRITLAILNLLPFFTQEERVVNAEEKQCLVWEADFKERLLEL